MRAIYPSENRLETLESCNLIDKQAIFCTFGWYRMLDSDLYMLSFNTLSFSHPQIPVCSSDHKISDIPENIRRLIKRRQLQKLSPELRPSNNGPKENERLTRLPYLDLPGVLKLHFVF